MEKLQCGDILVFKAGDNWLSKAIAWITESDVSHAAMMLNEKQMVEMSSNGIYVGNVEALNGDDSILLRLSSKKDPEPLAVAAQKYIDCKTRYDFPALVYLAGLIIYRRIRPTKKYMVITDIILREACVVLDRLIQSVILKNPDKTMVCSQLVYQIYEDCGNEYHISIEGGLLQASEGICLADIILKNPELAQISNDIIFSDEMSDNHIVPDVEELAKELYLALSEQDSEEETVSPQVDLGSLPFWAKRLLDKLEDFLEKSKSNIPIDALFIAPSDLAYKATNLDTVDRLHIKRLIKS